MSLHTIERVVCETLYIPDVRICTRERRIVFARQLCHYFAMSYELGSLSEIGQYFGGKDHATVLHSCKVINNYIETNDRNKLVVQMVEEKLKTLEDSVNEEAMKVFEQIKSEIVQYESESNGKIANVQVQYTSGKKVDIKPDEKMLYKLILILRNYGKS